MLGSCYADRIYVQWCSVLRPKIVKKNNTYNTFKEVYCGRTRTNLNINKLIFLYSLCCALIVGNQVHVT